MIRALLSLLLIPVGLAAGYAARRGAGSKLDKPGWFGAPVPLRLQQIAIFGLNPIAVCASVWGLRVGSSGLAALPFIGLAAMAFGLGAGLLAARFLGLGRDRGTVFALSTSMTNIGSVGSLAAFVILGEQAFAMVAFYKIFEELWYYGVCYPLAARAGSAGERKSLAGLLRDPYLAVGLASLAAGLAFNISGLPRPAFLKELTSWLVPICALLILVSVGMRMPGKREALKPSVLVAFLSIRLVLAPGFAAAAAVLGGLYSLADPTAFKIIMLISLMPSAFGSLIPPTIYGLDFRFSFSLWMASNLTLVAVMPALALLL